MTDSTTFALLPITSGIGTRSVTSRGSSADTGPSQAPESVDLDPSGGGIERVRRSFIERDRRARCVAMNQIDHLLEQLIVMSYAAADDDAPPGPRAKSLADDGTHVVAAVEADQAELGAHAMGGEPVPSDLYPVRDGLGVPRSRHPKRIEPEHEDPWCELRGGHHRTLLRGASGNPPPNRRDLI